MARQQRVFLALDEAPVLAAEAGVFSLAHLVERFAEMIDRHWDGIAANRGEPGAGTRVLPEQECSLYY